ncbi:MAG: putative addiction module antidote protein [Gammaproteobacteria bacterium]|nr:putative addiction module antidote protein [Gammaproteobacteria bacterium]
MIDKINVSNLPDFNPAEHLKNKEDIAAYLETAFEEDDPAALVSALGVVARATGMTEIANKSGLTREALYRSLRSGASPRFDTVARVLKALDLNLSVTSGA